MDEAKVLELKKLVLERAMLLNSSLQALNVCMMPVETSAEDVAATRRLLSEHARAIDEKLGALEMLLWEGRK